MRQFITILAVLFTFGLATAALAQGSTEGVINGQVINDTKGGSSVAGIDVSLITYINDVIAGMRTTKTDREGKFQFGRVATEHKYLVSAKYMEVDYYCSAAFDPGETKTYVEVMVCDATTSDEAIRVRLAHAIITVEEGSLLRAESADPGGVFGGSGGGVGEDRCAEG